MWIEIRENNKGTRFVYYERYKDPNTGEQFKVNVTLSSDSSHAKKEAARMLHERISLKKEKAKEDQEEIAAKSQFKMKINEFLSQFWGAFVGATVCNLGYSLQSDRIVDEIIDVRTEKNCTFFRMASIDYLIRTQNGHLPVKDIEECIKGKNKLDTFSRSILSQNVAVYLRNYQYDVNDKKAVCSLLNFNIKDIFIDEQKNKLISDV